MFWKNLICNELLWVSYGPNRLGLRPILLTLFLVFRTTGRPWYSNYHDFAKKVIITIILRERWIPWKRWIYYRHTSDQGGRSNLVSPWQHDLFFFFRNGGNQTVLTLITVLFCDSNRPDLFSSIVNEGIGFFSKRSGSTQSKLTAYSQFHMFFLEMHPVQSWLLTGNELQYIRS